MAAVALSAHSRLIYGTISDSVSLEGVPYSSVKTKDGRVGVISDEKGCFRLADVRLNDTLVVAAMGFSTKIIPTTSLTLPAQLYIAPTGKQLNEVVVRRKKQKYSKRNNPAVALMERIRSEADITNPLSKQCYSAEAYENITFGLNKFSAEDKKNLLKRRYKFLNDYIDTSEVSGSEVLTLSTREKSSDIYYDSFTDDEPKYIVRGVRRTGLDDFVDERSMRVLLEDFFKPIDIYKNDIDLLHNRFVSPLSRISADFYHFYITDTLMVDDMQCVELSFVPRVSGTLGFVGKLYIGQPDSLLFVKRIEMRAPTRVNLNFIEGLYIRQDFNRGPDGVRLIMSDDMVAEVAILPGMQGIYFRRNISYRDYDFGCKPHQNFQTLVAQAKVTDEAFWQKARFGAMANRHNDITELANRLRSDKLYWWAEQVLKVFVNGYITTSGKSSKFDIGPVNTTVSHNWLEGWRFRAGGITTANLSKHLFARGFVAWGLKDHRWKYKGEIEYSFNAKRYHSREFPVHSIRLTHGYDSKMIGQEFAFTNPDNMFLSLKRHEDYQMDYLRYTQLLYTLETLSGFSITGSIDHKLEQSAGFMQFVDGYGRDYRDFKTTSFKLAIRFCPEEKFWQMASQRVRINEEAPVFMLSHEYGPKGLFGNDFSVNRTEFSMQKRIWLSAFGYIDGIVKGGHIWTQSPYPLLAYPNANLSYTIQPESFALLNPMEFCADSYVTTDITYWLNGALLNYIPLLKRAKLREVVSFRGYWGHLSKKNNPDYAPELYRFPDINKTTSLSTLPYMEVGVGLDNIFRILRLDYVWRLTYRNAPNADRHGLRVALHFTF